MRIKWSNLLALALIVAAAVLLLRVGPHVRGLFDSALEPEHAWRGPHDRVFGIIALAMVLVTIVAVARILRRQEPGS